MRLKTFNVSEITSYIKRLISTDPMISNISVEGEISNYKVHSSGHAYFSIKDENAKLKVVMFKNDFVKCETSFKDGDLVIVEGPISVYERDGSYQLYAKKMTLAGEGKLYADFHKLKNELEELGFFDASHKKPIPTMPKNIGVITSPTGAAIRDILSVLNRRHRGLNIQIYPVRVQGQSSQYEICQAIEYFDKKSHVDLIILARGGGSIEELWSFNELSVAEAIYHCHIPIITGVGHETDFTIADYVADLRTPTPSIAAEQSVASIDINDKNLELKKNKLLNNYRAFLDGNRNELSKKDPKRMKRDLSLSISNHQMDLDKQYDNIKKNIHTMIDEYKLSIDRNIERISVSNPINLLEKGFCTVSKGDNKIVSVNEIEINKEISIDFIDGKVTANVEEVKKYGKKN